MKLKLAAALLAGVALGAWGEALRFTGMAPTAEVDAVKAQSLWIMKRCQQIQARQRDPDPPEFRICPKSLRPDGCNHPVLTEVP